MKVCFVTGNYPPEAIGGTEQVLVALARELRAAGVDVAVIAGSAHAHAGVDEGVEVHDGVPVFRLPRRADEDDTRGVLRPRLLALLERRLRALAPDVLHVHSFSHLSAGLGALARAMARPMVLTCHDLWVTCPRYFRIPAGGVTCPIGVDRTPCVTCVNDALHGDPAVVAPLLAERDRVVAAEVLAAAVRTAPSRTAAGFVTRAFAGAPAVEVIPHGLLRPVPAAQRAPAPRPGERLRVGTFGGLVAEKGVLELVHALAGVACELHLSGPFHGDGFAERVQAQAARQGTLLVLRGRYDVDAWHPARDLHLAVFPSKCQETYGLVVDEALAHGVPVVCSDAGALAERATTPGVCVTPLANLANVLRELVGSPERLAVLRAAIPVELPTIARSAHRHLELYRSLR